MNIRNTLSPHRALRLSTLATALSLAMFTAPAWADPLPCEVVVATAGPDGFFGTADDTAPGVNCGGTFSPLKGVASVGEVSATLGATAIGQFVVVEPTTAGIDSNVDGRDVYPDASVGVGYRTRVDGGRNVAVGANSRIGGTFGEFLSVEDSVAIGSTTVVTGNNATAVGAHAWTNGDAATVVGSGTFASAAGATIMGAYSGSSIEGAVAIGRSTFVNSPASGSISLNTAAVPAAIAGTSVGDRSRVSGDNSVALGGFAVVGVRNSFAMVNDGTALGAGTLVSAEGGVAVGARASVASSAANAVAIGADSVADEQDAVSFGSAGNERRLTHVDDGVGGTDAVNVRQLQFVGNTLATGFATYLGGGAAWNPATYSFTAPTFVIQSNDYNTVGDAFGAVDAQITDINSRIVASGGIQGERGYSVYEIAGQNGFAGTEAQWLASLKGEKGDVGNIGPAGPQGPAGQDGVGSVAQIEAIADAGDARTLADANAYSDAGDAATLQSAQAYADVGDVATLASANGYTDTRETAIRGDMAAGDAQTLADANTYADITATQTLTSANAYTDQKFAGWNDSFTQYQHSVDQRFRQQDRRIDRQAAIAGAYAGMAMNTAGLAGRNRVGVGVGAQGGEKALAIGYQRAIGNRASVSLGGALSGSEKSVMGGAGFSW